MDYYERENFWIELKNSLLNFYNKENKIYVARYEEHKLVEENIIFDKCQTLNTVILSSDGDISLIYINLKGELFLSNFINNKLENSVILTRAVSKNNYMQIASVNNSLNIFYINEVNTISTICFPLWNQPRLVYKKLFKKPFYEYFKSYAIYALVTLIGVFITTFTCNLLVNGNGFISLVFKGIICLIIPNIVICLVFYKKGEFKYIMILIKSILNANIKKLISKNEVIQNAK